VKGRRAVVLVSGGLDSAVSATIAKCERYDLYALTVDYGQRNRREIEAAKRVADALRAKEHKILPVPLTEFGGSALTDAKVAVPKNRTRGEIGHGIPTTYVPGRNTILLSLGLAYAETVDADAVFIGAHALDSSGYPDCRPEYFDKFNEMAKVANKRGVEGEPIKVLAPLLGWNKAKIVETGVDLKAPLRYTWSCYEAGEAPCGACDACQLRREAFAQAGHPDPALAAAKP
jgi:7-cyano-7-deazaguanine synthase